MKIRILTICTPELDGLGRLSIPNKRHYCARHGYSINVHESLPETGRPAVWAKIPMLIQDLDQFDYLFWSDADSVFMNQDIPLESLVGGSPDLVITREDHPLNPGGVNAGHFLLRNSPLARAFIEMVYQQEQFLTDPLQEQAAMNYVLDKDLCPLEVRYPPKRAMNAEVTDYEEGDFILHFQGQPTRAFLVRKFLRHPAWENACSAADQLAPTIAVREDGRIRSAVIAARQGHQREAEDICRSILAKTPEHADAAHLLGLLSLEARRTDEAFDLLCRSIEMDPLVPRYHANLGSALGRFGLHWDAVIELNRAVRLDRNLKDAQENLATARRNLQHQNRRRCEAEPAAGCG